MSKSSWNVKRICGAVVVIIALYLIFNSIGIFNFSPNIEGPTNLGAVFLIGIIAAFSSCTAVVAGLVTAVSVSAANTHPNATFSSKIRPHLLFNAGRLGGFALFGAAIGAIGQAVSLSSTLNALLILAIAILMIGLGINLLDVIPNKFAIHPPKWLSKRILKLSDSKHPLTPVLLGAATFFLPCGFTQSMQLYALSVGDPLTSALIMTMFAIGTLPALLGIGVIASASKQNTLTLLSHAAGAIVVVLGIANLQNSAALFGWQLPSFTSEPETVESNLENGEQVIQMEVTSYGVYQPDTLTVTEGVPVRWEIYGSKNMGCGSTLVMSAFGIQKDLSPGFNEITFTPTKSGTFTFTCSMGMFRGKMIVKPQL